MYTLIYIDPVANQIFLGWMIYLYHEVTKCIFSLLVFCLFVCFLS